MQTDPSASLSLKLTNKIPVREIQIDTTAKVPDASLNLIQSMDEAFPEKKQIDDNFRAQLLEIGLYLKNFRQHSTKDNSDIVEPQNFVRLSGTTIAANGYPDPADLFQVLNLKHEILNLENKQEKDPDIEDVKKRIRTEQVPNLTYENSRRKKYAKQFNR